MVSSINSSYLLDSYSCHHMLAEASAFDRLPFAPLDPNSQVEFVVHTNLEYIKAVLVVESSVEIFLSIAAAFLTTTRLVTLPE